MNSFQNESHFGIMSMAPYPFIHFEITHFLEVISCAYSVLLVVLQIRRNFCVFQVSFSLSTHGLVLPPPLPLPPCSLERHQNNCCSAGYAESRIVCPNRPVYRWSSLELRRVFGFYPVINTVLELTLKFCLLLRRRVFCVLVSRPFDQQVWDVPLDPLIQPTES